MGSKIRFITPQAASIYQLLLKEGAMTACEIGKKLGIFPNAVYREAGILENLGCIKRNGRYPVKYAANPVSDAVEIYLFIQKKQFLSDFSINKTKRNPRYRLEKPLDVSFIKNRKALNDQSNADVKSARKEIDLIVSGLEVSAETILEYKRAIERGVTIKVLVQGLAKENKEMLGNWRRLGIEVRWCNTVSTRLFIIDSQITYIVSYNPENREEAIGVRFHYPPIAQLLNELFMRRWKTAKML